MLKDNYHLKIIIYIFQIFESMITISVMKFIENNLNIVEKKRDEIVGGSEEGSNK